MRPLLVLLLAFSLSSPAFARRRPVDHRPPYDVPAVHTIAAAALRQGVPGMTISIRKGNAFFNRAYGVFNRETGAPATTRSVYQIASVSKQFTAAAVMRLVEQGTLSVSDRARKWLPELDERFDAITIEHLLTHTSGVRDYNVQLKSAYEPQTQQQILALITNGPPGFTPGSAFDYSNSGYFLLGMIIERAAARSYAEVLRDFFFEPLAMHETSYCGTNGPVPDGYYIHPRDGVHPLPAADMSIVFSAGALCSTASDLVRWTSFLGNGTAVTAESFAQMTTPRRAQYGYGLIVNKLDGRRAIWHNGSILGFQSAVLRFPDEELTIAVLINVIDLGRDRAGEIALQIARAMRP